MSHQRIALLGEFACLGADCEDTCCKGWDMQLDQPHRDLYKSQAPELLDAVDEHDGQLIMRRDAETDFCVKYSSGLCLIHKEKDEDFLGDACHFFPRSTRRFGEHVVMSAAFSCPEVVRLAANRDDAFALVDASFDRVPESLTDYLPGDMHEDHALAVMQAVVDLLEDDTRPPEVSLMMLCSVARSMDNLPQSGWHESIPFYLRTAMDRLAMPELLSANAYRLVHALYVVLLAMPKVDRPRLRQTMDEMLAALDATIDPATHMIASNRNDFSAYEELTSWWAESGQQAAMAPLLRRWLAGQVRLHGFPFAGMGDSVAERAAFLAFRFALIRLAVMASLQQSKEEDVHIRAIQSMSRVIDHLGSADLLRQICEDAGWMRESGQLALIAG